MRIFERLQQACKSKDMKLKDFVEVTGLPYRTGQSYLSGTREPNPEGMQIICTQMGINLNWLITGEGVMFIADLDKFSADEQESELLSDFRKTNQTGKNAIMATAKVMVNELPEEL